MFQLTLIGLAVAGVLAGALVLARYVTNTPAAQEIVASMGYLGVLIVGIVGGLSTFVPFVPASFTPAFLASGLLLPIIILMLTIGTTLADLLAYALGTWSAGHILEHYPKTYQYIQKLNIDNTLMLGVFICVYAAVVPFPNEAFIIPLALLGVPIRSFIVPLLIGTAFYHTATAYGAQSIFHALF